MNTKLAISIFTIVLSGFSYIAYGQNVGIGTSVPKGKLEVVASENDSVAFKVSQNNATLFKVANGGASVGTAGNPPEGGLAVAGVIQPGDSIKSSTRPIYISSVNDSIVLYAGGTRIIISANGAVTIKTNGAAGITLDAGVGNVSIKGNNVNIQAVSNATVTSNAITNIQSAGSTTITGNAFTRIVSPMTTVSSTRIKLGGDSAAKQAARVGDLVTSNGVSGTIVTGSGTVLIQ